ncbi:hypothetical protein SAMN02745673_00430 [Marinactinospora thermotolerans DSM 45154]|uniref:Uncharacterized protein n=1 Tax=Marinactinospora thermotolerans DSM 45154 TaxID=1122192 RepID=A0A1T4KKR7_9ACTN|nr:hypothetical protein [Marinactinospora thermotolerans]SJZ42995.1 hypothetical protein SAMN02745673_00430 [Marinactinospora thermotolerans DSM 45154]
MSRVLPALVLFVLSPFVAEYLLGNLSLTDPTTLMSSLPLALLYGGGALLIRETTRRAGRGWPTILLLGAAYGLVEEGVVTQSLFNPDFMGYRLLDYGYVPALGTGLPWAVYVIGIHTVWSIAVPIALTEALFPGRAPWLRLPGLVIVAVGYLLAAAALTAGLMYGNGRFASTAQWVVVGGIVLALVTAAFVLTRRVPGPEADDAAAAGPLWVPAAVGFGGGAVFFLAYAQEPLLPPALALAIQAATVVAVVVWAVRRSARRAWTDRHRCALAAGTALVYCWGGYVIHLSHFGTAFAGLAVHTAVVVVGLAVVAGAVRRSATHAAAPR